MYRRTALTERPYGRNDNTIGGAPVRVARVVVVDVARVVDIPHVVRVAAMRRTQARITAYSPISKLYVFIAFGI